MLFDKIVKIDAKTYELLQYLTKYIKRKNV